MPQIDLNNLTRLERALVRRVYDFVDDELEAARIMTKLYELIQTGLFRIGDDRDQEYN